MFCYFVIILGPWEPKTTQNSKKYPKITQNNRKLTLFLKIFSGGWFKKGGNFLFWTNILLVIDAKFNIDNNFAIKHDLII